MRQKTLLYLAHNYHLLYIMTKILDYKKLTIIFRIIPSLAFFWIPSSFCHPFVAIIQKVQNLN
jgi:hypothetical protein